MQHNAIDPRHFRDVMGRYPTGVAVVTGFDGERPVGMAMGSFASVSLDPPLIAVMPDHRSTSWPKIRETGKFCVNILSENQQDICRTFATKNVDKFAEVEWYLSDLGSPILSEAIGWVDCEIEAIHPTGDHDIVIGKVSALEQTAPEGPLIFYRGGYGSFRQALQMDLDAQLLNYLAVSDQARLRINELAQETGTEVSILGLLESELVLLTSAGWSPSESTTWVGQKIPAIPPMGAAMMAWQAEDTVSEWMSGLEDSSRLRIMQQLNTIRERGYSVLLDGPHSSQLATLIRSRRLPDTDHLTEEESTLLSQVEMDPSDFSEEQMLRTSRLYLPVFDAAQRCHLLLGLHFTNGVSSRDEFNDVQQAALTAAQDISVMNSGFVSELRRMG